MSIENIKEKLKKLLSISKDDSASENEIESSLRIAARLMQSYHLSEEDLFESEEDQVSKIEKSSFKSIKTYVGGKKFKWETILLSYVARLVGGVVIYTGHRELKKTPSGLLVNGCYEFSTLTGNCFYRLRRDIDFDLFYALRRLNEFDPKTFSLLKENRSFFKNKIIDALVFGNNLRYLDRELLPREFGGQSYRKALEFHSNFNKLIQQHIKKKMKEFD